MINQINNLRSEQTKKLKRSVITLSVIFLFIVPFVLIDLVAAQTPPEIPDYQIPDDQDEGIQIPSEPDNQGVPRTEPSNPTPTPIQPYYIPIAIAIIAVAVISALICAWIIDRKKQSLNKLRERAK
jgi:ABC-type antimicrobial peptide transport system permease subunit